MSANVEMIAALIQQRDAEEAERQEILRRARAEAKRQRKIANHNRRLDNLKIMITKKQQIIALDLHCFQSGGTRERSKFWWEQELKLDELELWDMHLKAEELFEEAETDELADKAFALIREDRKHLYRSMPDEELGDGEHVAA